MQIRILAYTLDLEMGEASWLSANEEYLAAAVAWLRLRLAYLIGSQQSDGKDAPVVSISHIEEAEAAMVAAGSQEPPPTLLLLNRLFRLSKFGRETLLLCAAVELDTGIANLCAQAQADLSRPFPTFALAMSLFDNPSWEVLAADRPLRYWQLVEINQRHAQPLTTSPLRADERIAGLD